MDTVTGPELAIALDRLGGIGVVGRFDAPAVQARTVQTITAAGARCIGVIGVKADTAERVERLIAAGAVGLHLTLRTPTRTRHRGDRSLQAPLARRALDRGNHRHLRGGHRPVRGRGQHGQSRHRGRLDLHHAHQHRRGRSSRSPPSWTWRGRAMRRFPDRYVIADGGAATRATSSRPSPPAPTPTWAAPSSPAPMRRRGDRRGRRRAVQALQRLHLARGEAAPTDEVRGAQARAVPPPRRGGGGDGAGQGADGRSRRRALRRHALRAQLCGAQRQSPSCTSEPSSSRSPALAISKASHTTSSCAPEACRGRRDRVERSSICAKSGFRYPIPRPRNAIPSPCRPSPRWGRCHLTSTPPSPFSSAKMNSANRQSWRGWPARPAPSLLPAMILAEIRRWPRRERSARGCA